MLGTLPPHAKKSWSEWVATLTHAYNCTMSQTMGFSPFFLMFGQDSESPNQCRVWCHSTQLIGHQLTKLCSEAEGMIEMGLQKGERGKAERSC